MNQTSKETIRYWRLTALINCLIFLVLVLGLLFVNQWLSLLTLPTWTFTLVLVLVALQWSFFIGLLPTLKAKYFKYELNGDQLEVYKGILFRYQLSIPLIRVQNVQTDVGPLLKIFGLIELKVTTASDTNYLPELKTDEALHIQRSIQERIDKSYN